MVRLTRCLAILAVLFAVLVNSSSSYAYTKLYTRTQINAGSTSDFPTSRA
jgi:hypothetical protein